MVRVWAQAQSHSHPHWLVVNTQLNEALFESGSAFLGNVSIWRIV